MKPDFCIAGAAKCGTTALFSYLSRHPGVFMPRIKEPKFFCTDLQTTGGVYEPEAYRELFEAAPPGALTGEASGMYLYSTVAIPLLMQHNPKARVIVSLRDPLDAAQSLHAARWSHGHENLQDFEDAWNAQAERLAGQRLPLHWPDPVTLQYGAIYRYAAQVRRVIEHVPPQQRHFIIYEEFFAEPAVHFPRLLRFLGLPPVSDVEFPVVNATRAARSQRVDRWLREPPHWLSGVSRLARPVTRATGLRAARFLRALNSAPGEKHLLRPDFRRELRDYFAADIAELEGLLRRSLWSASSASSASGRTLETYRSH